MYLKSKQVQVYPSAYRGQVNDGPDQIGMFNPESRLPTEFNVTNQTYNISDSFIIKPIYSGAAITTSSTFDLEFVIHGYWFKVENFKLDDLLNLTEFNSANTIYATIKLHDKNNSVTEEYLTYKATSLVNIENPVQVLDSSYDAEVSVFQALKLSPSAGINQGEFNLKLFEKSSSNWYLCKYSYKKLEEYNVGSNNNYGGSANSTIDEYLETDEINVCDSALHATDGSLTVNAYEESYVKLTNWDINSNNIYYMGPMQNRGTNLVASLDTRKQVRLGGYNTGSTSSWRNVFINKRTNGNHYSYFTDLGDNGFTLDYIESSDLSDYFSGQGDVGITPENLLQITEDNIHTKTLDINNNEFRSSGNIIRFTSNKAAQDITNHGTNLTPNRVKGIVKLDFNSFTCLGKSTAVPTTSIRTGVNDQPNPPSQNRGSGEFRFYCTDSTYPAESQKYKHFHECLYVGLVNDNYPNDPEGPSDFTPEVSTVGYMEAAWFNATSDKRLKENIKTFEPHKSILDLPVVEFDYKSDHSHHIGCLAQDLQEICPEIVHENKDGYLTIEENKIVYLLLQEVKDLKEEIKKLKGE